MALKKKITETAYEKLAEHFKGEYKKVGDDYVLDVEGDDDLGELRRAHDRVKQEAKEAKEARDKMKRELDELGDGDARKKGDIATLEKSWKEKMDAEVKKRDDDNAKLRGTLTNTLVDNVAIQLASKLSEKNSKVLLPHIKSRLQADFDGDTPATRVLDKNGKPSALTVDDLQKEFMSDPDFAGIITASKANGGAGSRNPVQNGGGAPRMQNEKPADFASMNMQEKVAYLKEKKQTESEQE